jgi:hypothetical protein
MTTAMTTIWIYDADRRGHYTVIHEGGILLDGVRDPEHEAARALEAEGISGLLRVRDARSDRLRSTVPIHKAALMRVSEEETGLRIRRWRPIPRGLKGR